VQDVVENKPDQYQNSNPPGNDHEGLDAIKAGWITPDHVAAYLEGTGIATSRFFTAGFFRFRFPAAGFVLLNFFLARFHEKPWEGTL